MLELNYLTAILLLNYFNNKVVIKYQASKESEDSFKLNHPVYIDIPMAFMHLSIICARELYEAKQGQGLEDGDWKRLNEIRNAIVHAKKPEDQQIRIIGTANEVFDILNKLNNYIYNKYDLQSNAKWQKHIEKYYNDLDNY